MMKTTFSIGLVFLLLTGSGCQIFKYIFPQEAYCRGCANEKRNREFQTRYDQIYQAGEQEGTRIGESEGIKKGREEALNEFLARINESWERDSSDKVKLAYIIYWLSNMNGPKPEILLEFDRGKRIGLQTAFTTEQYFQKRDSAYQEGYSDAFANYNRIKFSREEYASPVDSKLPLTLEYNYIAKGLLQLSKQKSELAYTTFDGIVYHVHERILDQLSCRLGLSEEDRKRALEEYEQMHDGIVELYYDLFHQYIQTTHQNYKKDFYPYPYYRSVETFMDIVGFRICSLADVVYTRVYFNSQATSVEGLKLFGHVCELTSDVLIEAEDYLKKASLIFDYQTHVPQVETQAVEILEPMVVETRQDSRVVSERIKVDQDYSATVSMKIHTVVELGFDLNDFAIEVDHELHLVTVNLPDRPKILKVVSQTYEILSVKNQITYTEHVEITRPILNFWHDPISPQDLIRKTTETQRTKTTKLPSHLLLNMFEQNKPDPYQMDQFEKPLECKKQKLFNPLIAKILEPMISLPNVCYDVELERAKGKTEKLFSINCK